MKRSDPRGNYDETLAIWEAALQAALLPLEPRPIFISGLKQRLLEPQFEQETAPIKPGRILWTAAGVITSLLLVITGIRAITTLVTHLKSSVPKGGLNPAS